jgi:hypothetical protein
VLRGLAWEVENEISITAANAAAILHGKRIYPPTVYNYHHLARLYIGVV